MCEIRQENRIAALCFVWHVGCTFGLNRCAGSRQSTAGNERSSFCKTGIRYKVFINKQVYCYKNDVPDFDALIAWAASRYADQCTQGLA